MKSITELLNAAYKSKISNGLIANVNNMAYSNIRSKGLKKYLARRAQKTVKILNEAEAEIKKHTGTLDYEQLTKKYQELLE